MSAPPNHQELLARLGLRLPAVTLKRLQSRGNFLPTCGVNRLPAAHPELLFLQLLSPAARSQNWAPTAGLSMLRKCIYMVRPSEQSRGQWAPRNRHGAGPDSAGRWYEIDSLTNCSLPGTVSPALHRISGRTYKVQSSSMVVEARWQRGMMPNRPASGVRLYTIVAARRPQYPVNSVMRYSDFSLPFGVSVPAFASVANSGHKRQRRSDTCRVISAAENLKTCRPLSTSWPIPQLLTGSRPLCIRPCHEIPWTPPMMPRCLQKYWTAGADRCSNIRSCPYQPRFGKSTRPSVSSI